MGCGVRLRMLMKQVTEPQRVMVLLGVPSSTSLVTTPIRVFAPSGSGSGISMHSGEALTAGEPLFKCSRARTANRSTRSGSGRS